MTLSTDAEQIIRALEELLMAHVDALVLVRAPENLSPVERGVYDLVRRART